MLNQDIIHRYFYRIGLTAMFPSKITMDFMAEMNRLFPKTEKESELIPNAFSSPFQTPNANKSSSSADSISPESYFDLPFQFSRSTELFNIATRPVTPFETSRHIGSPSSTHKPQLNHFDSVFSNFDNNNHDINASNFGSNLTIYESQSYNYNQSNTPVHVERQRPIVGRKILGGGAQSCRNEPTSYSTDTVHGSWQSGIAHTPEKLQKSYELFPSDDRNFGICTPVKNSTNATPIYIPPHDVSPTSSNISPSSLLCRSRSPTFSPNWSNRVHNPVPNITNPFNPISFSRATSSQDEIGPTKMCTFCRKNGETPTVYMTHLVKEKINNKYVVTCPILRAHVCSTCGASGDKAHTITYCPIQRSSNHGRPPPSTTIILKNTRIKSNGRRRF